LALVAAGLCHAATTAIHSVGHGNTQMCTTVPQTWGPEVGLWQMAVVIFTICKSNSGHGLHQVDFGIAGATLMEFDDFFPTTQLSGASLTQVHIYWIQLSRTAAA